MTVQDTSNVVAFLSKLTNDRDFASKFMREPTKTMSESGLSPDTLEIILTAGNFRAASDAQQKQAVTDLFTQLGLDPNDAENAALISKLSVDYAFIW